MRRRFAQTTLLATLALSIPLALIESAESSQTSTHGALLCSVLSAEDLGHLGRSQSERINKHLPPDKIRALFETIDSLAQRDVWVRLAAEMLDREDVEIVVSTIESPEVVLNSGLWNVHARGNAWRGAIISARRNYTEATYLQLPFADYAALSPGEKPKYAVLVPRGLQIVAPGYGNNLYRVPLSHVRERMTFSVGGDSYIRMSFLPQLPLNFWSEFQGPRFPDRVPPIPDWSYLFLPWKYRKLLAPSLAEMLRTQKAEIPRGFRDPLDVGHRSREYIEVQLFGALDGEILESIGPAAPTR